MQDYAGLMEHSPRSIIIISSLSFSFRCSRYPNCLPDCAFSDRVLYHMRFACQYIPIPQFLSNFLFLPKYMSMSHEK